MIDAVIGALERSGALPLPAEERRSLLRAGAGAGVRRVEADRDLLRAGDTAAVQDIIAAAQRVHTPA